MYFTGKISFGDDGLTAEEAKSFTAEIFNNIMNTIAPGNNSPDIKTSYIVQEGDTPKIIAKKLGLRGRKAKQLAKNIEQNATQAGLYTEGHLTPGDMITLNGDFSTAINQLRDSGQYTESLNRNDEISNEVRAEIEQEKENANISKNESQNIVNSIINEPVNAKNSGIQNIPSKDVVFVLAIYNQTTKRNLAVDLLNNTDVESVKNLLCSKLAQRASELKIGGVYYGDYMKINDKKALLDWINNAQEKIYQAEVRKNSSISQVISNDKSYPPEERNPKDVKVESQNLAAKLFKQISGASKNSNTIDLLKQISSDNVAYLVTEYKNTKANSNHCSLIKDIDEEWGLDIEEIKEYICKNLVRQAEKLHIDIDSYNDIDDIDKLETWINNLSNQIINAMELNAYDNPSLRLEESTKIEGDYKVKTTTSAPNFEEAGIDKIEEYYDSSDNLLHTLQYFKNGKIVKEYQDEERGRVREIIESGNDETKQEERVSEYIPMEMKLPDNASENAKTFAKALEDNKEELMKELGIDNDTYNELAKLAMAIAEQETNFGNNGGMYRDGKYKSGKYIGEALEVFHDFSFGATQIKYELYKKDDAVASKFKKFGLNDGSDLMDMKNSAIATMIVLAQINRTVHSQKYQNGANAARGNIVTVPDWELINGKLEKTGNTKSFVNEVTDEDLICYLWNGKGVQILDGTMEPESNSYTRNVHEYLKKYSIEEDPNVRAQYTEKERSKKVVKEFKPMDNNGALGSIAFMPGMYKYDELTDQSDELKVLKNSLSKNTNIKEESKRLLIQAVENGEIGFEFGLTANEADSLTQSDADLILAHLQNIKNIINDNRIDFSNGLDKKELKNLRNNYIDIIRDEELRFKRNYLASHADIIDASAVPEDAILSTPLNNAFTYHNTNTKRGFAGDVNNEIKDLGVNKQNTSAAGASFACFAQLVASSMKESGHSGFCLQGVKDSFRNAGMDISDWEEGTPRGSVKYFERHPEMFEEVKYIGIGNGQARQINSTDLPNLPAGYIVIWIPDQNNTDFQSEPGHISITNGNGQAYADETDNLDWGVYQGVNKAGKGEHGYFRVFRLTDKWDIDPSTGKLVFKG